MPGEIFLSASAPVPGRGDFYKTADPFLIQLAVRELVILLMNSRRRLVWGGHPAITPMIWAVCEDLNVDYAKSVILYQSQYFEDLFPEENERFRNVVYVKRELDMADSLTAMRREMIQRPDIEGAVFIGGMDGLFEELEIYQELHPERPIVPVMATGGAAAILGEKLDISDPRFSSLDFVDLYISTLGS